MRTDHHDGCGDTTPHGRHQFDDAGRICSGARTYDLPGDA